MTGNQFEIPKEMRSMAEASLDQARKAFESFISNAQQTAAAFGGASFGAPGEAAKDISAKAIAFAEKNVQSSLAHRICAGPDARAGGAGQRNGAGRDPRRHGCRQAQIGWSSIGFSQSVK